MMKKHTTIISLLLLLVCILSCTPKHEYPSPFEGVSITDQTFESDELKRTIDVSSYMTDVLVACTEVTTGDTCRWLTVRPEKDHLYLTLTENITINDRKAKVKLYIDPSNENVDQTISSLVFYVTQKKSSKFEGIDISELLFTHERHDSIIELPRTLSNVKTEVLPMDSGEVKWCTARLAGDALTVKVEENKSKGLRQAIVKITPKTSDDTSDDLTAKIMFLVTQHQNPVLDSLSIDPVTLTYEGKAQVVKTDRQLKGIKAQVIDNDTHNRASWCTATVAGDSITVKATELSSLSERSAQVVLYLPNNGEVIDSTTISYSFKVTQQHNTVFDGVNIPDATIHHDQTRTAFKVVLPGKATMKNIKSIVKDAKTQEDISWLKVSAAGDSIVLTASVHKDKSDRSAHVTLYYPSGQTIDANTIKTNFTVTQLHNTVFDNIKIDAVYLKHDETRHVFKLQTQMKDISAKTFDHVTGKEVNWVTAKAAGDSVVLTSSVYREAGSRKAKIMLYYSNGKAISDPSVVKDSFLVVQNHNTVFDDDKILQNPWNLNWDQTERVFRMTNLLTDIKCRLIDAETSAAPKWLSATIQGREVTFKSSVNKGLKPRRAYVTLYYPNGNNFEDSQIRYNFTLQQHEMQQLSVETRKVEAGYQSQGIDVNVTSNVDFEYKNGKSWVEVSIKRSSYEENKYTVELYLKENDTEEVRKDVVYLTGGSDNQLKDSIVVTQKTNPTIQLFDGNTTKQTFGKDGGEFMLPVHTLTPNYKIVKTASWISVGKQERKEKGLYYHKITVQRFTGEGSLRKETIVVKNDEKEQSIVIDQHRYLALDVNETEVEVGTQFQLHATNYTSKAMEWKSSNEKVATVDQSGNVTAVGKGSANIYVSIGSYYDLEDYNDYCKLKVYDAYDKVLISRGLGDYQKSDGFVTANCPVVITNNYHSSITLSSVEIVGNNGSWGTSGYFSNGHIPSGGSISIDCGSLSHVYQPKVVIKFFANNKEYEKKADY